VHPAHDADSPGATLPPHRVNSAGPAGVRGGPRDPRHPGADGV